MAENKYLDLPELIPEELIERAKKLSPAQLCDGMAALGIERNGCMDASLMALDVQQCIERHHDAEVLV